MITLHAEASALTVTEGLDDTMLVAGMANVASIRVTFSEDWTGLGKTLLFYNGDKTILHLMLSDDEIVPIPHEVLATPGRTLYVGVQGSDGERVILPTVRCKLKSVLASIDPDGDRETIPDKPHWEQIREDLEQLADDAAATAQEIDASAAAVREDRTAAETAAGAASGSASAAAGDATAAASAAEAAAASAEAAQAVKDSIPEDYTELSEHVQDLYFTRTASGDPAVIENHAEGYPLVRLDIPFSGTQTGEGDPSPENYRAFAVPQAITVHAGNRNLYGGDAMIADFSRYLGKTITGRTISFHGNDDTYTPHPPCIDGVRIDFKEKTAYTFVVTLKTGETSANLRIFYTDGAHATFAKSEEKTTQVIVTDAARTVESLRVYYGSALTTTIYPDECGIFEGVHTAEEFLPYDAAVTVPLTAAGDVYAGTLDAVTGKLRATTRILTLTGEENWNTISGTAPYHYIPIGAYNSVVADSDHCSSLPHAAISSTDTAIGARVLNSAGGDEARLLIRTGEDRDTFKAWLANMAAAGTPVQVTYQLTAPAEETVTPAEIPFYTGYTAYSADTGKPVTAEYYAAPEDMDAKKANRRQINILAVGNSFTQGAWGYVPALLREAAPDTDFTIGVLYRSGTEIGAYASHPDDSTWGSDATIYNEWTADASGWTHSSGYSLNEVLARHAWNIVYGQVTSVTSGDAYTGDIGTVIDDSRRFMDLIRAKCGNVKLVTGSFVSWAAPAHNGEPGATALGRFFDDCVAAGAFEDYTPVGAAIATARTRPEVRRLGRIGLMRYNRTTEYGSGHLQNGTPLLIAACTIAAKLLSWCGYDYKGILGSHWVPTAANIVAIGCMTQAQMDADGIGMTHGTPIFMDPEDPAEDLRFAQETAVKAVETPDRALPWDIGGYGSSDADRIAGAYNPMTIYEPGACCTYRGALWRCAARTLAAYDPETAYARDDRFEIKGTIYAIIPEYDAADTYEINDCCTHDGGVYFCVGNVTVPEAFDAAKWQLFDVYSTAVNYTQGATVSAGIELYFCNTATSGGFDPTKWVLVGKRIGTQWVRVSNQPFAAAAWERMPIMDASSAAVDAAEDAAKAIGYGAYVMREITGDPAVFGDAAAGVPLRSVTVAVQGEQQGSGTAAPDNIRPITGYNTLQLYHSGADRTSPTVYNAQLVTTASDVYTGIYDAATGIMTVTAALLTFNGTEANWREVGSGDSKFFRHIVNRVKTTPRGCSHFANASIVTSNTNIGYYAYNYSSSNGALQIRPGIETVTDLASWRQWLQDQAAAGTPLQCYYTLETPRLHQMPKMEIQALAGENALWSDAGTVTAQYGADPETVLDGVGYTTDAESRRAQALIRKADMSFTALKTIRASTATVKYFEAGKTYSGIPYSGMEWAGRDVLFDISLEAILSAFKNPYADLYKYDWEASNPPSRTADGAAVWAGAVCSTWVSWLTNRPLREVVDQIDHELTYKTINGLEDLEVGDVMLQSGHVAAITGFKLQNNEIVRVNVSEMWKPNFRSLWYTPEQFWSRLYDGGTKENPGSNPFKVGRFPDDYKIRSVPEAEIVDDIISSRGDNAHFQLGEDILLFITEPDPELTIIAPDGTSTTFDYTTITPETEDGEPIPVYNFKTVLDSVGLWKIKGASGKYWSRVTVYDIPGDVTAVQTQSGSTYTTTVTVGTHSGCSIAGFQVLTMYKDRGIYPVPAEAAAQGFVGAHGTTWKRFHDVVTSSPFTIDITNKADDNYFVRVYFQTGCGFAFKDSNPIFVDGDSGDDDIPTPES